MLRTSAYYQKSKRDFFRKRVLVYTHKVSVVTGQEARRVLLFYTSFIPLLATRSFGLPECGILKLR